MYGLVNKAIQELVVERYDESTWDRILELSGIDEEGFIGMDPYPDDLTFALLDTAARELELELSDLLEAFGEYWITYTSREGYGELLDMAGTTLEGFVLNLDRIHDRIRFTFPELRAPAFRSSVESDGSLSVEYSSTRFGLAPMVVGLLRGLAKRFRESVRVEHAPPETGGGAHTFRIYREAA